jgi:hypothetical protein
VSLNNEKVCCEISEDKIAFCEKPAGLRSGNGVFESVSSRKSMSDLRHRIKIHIEGPLTSEALKFLSSRMSHYAFWPPFS